MKYRERQKILFRRLKRSGKIPFLVANLTDIKYLTGFSGSDAMLVIGEKGVSFGTDGRYAVQTDREVSADDTLIYERKRSFATRYFKKGGKTYFDRDRFSFSMYRQILKWGYDLEPARSPIFRMRMVKEREEVEVIEKAAVISSTAFLSSLHSLNGDTTESEVAALLEFEMKKRGAEGSSFPPIVVSGEKTALPHATPGDESMDAKEVMLFDFGCRFRGYCSDETITILPAKGTSRGELGKIMDTVRRARDVALNALKPGVRCIDVDRITREMIDKRGYGRYFVHSTGHGVGLEVHEPPYISRFSMETLKPGMVVTIEPGIYIPGKGGVRLEDLVAITENSHERITYLPKDGKITL